jgi:hypothetical protein
MKIGDLVSQKNKPIRTAGVPSDKYGEIVEVIKMDTENCSGLWVRVKFKAEDLNITECDRDIGVSEKDFKIIDGYFYYFTPDYYWTKLNNED